MDLSGRRRSTNVEDRRGKSGGKIAGFGIGGAIIPMGSFSLSGIGLSALAGVILNLVIPKAKES